MTKTKLVGRTAASVLGLIGLAMTADARANHQICPDCPSVNATIAYDSVASELYLDVDAFPSFDHGSVDTVELELTENNETEIVALSFVPSDIEYGLSETEGLPSTMTGSGTSAVLVFSDSSTSEQIRVEVTPE